MIRRLMFFLVIASTALLLTNTVLAQEDGILEGRGEFELVLIHGLGSNAEVWDEVLPYLLGTFKVAVFELAGHGNTQPILDPTIAKEEKRLEAFIKEQGFVYPTLVGHALGGMIALQYALNHPSDVHRLIMMDSAPMQIATEQQKKDVAQALIDDYDHFVAGRYSVMSPEAEVTEKIVDAALKTDSASFVSLLMSSFDFDLTDRLSTLTVPTLVIGSELLFPTSNQSQAILKQIGFGHAHSLSFKRLGRTGHFMMLERPINTASVILAFGVSADHIFED